MFHHSIQLSCPGCKVQVCIIFTYSTNKAGVVPSVTKCLEKFVSSLNRELTAMATNPKQTVKVCFKNKE